MKFREPLLALNMLLISSSTLALSDFADSFRMKELSLKLAQKIAEERGTTIKGIVAISGGGFEPSTNLARALKTNIVEVLSLNDDSDQALELKVISELRLPQPCDRKEIPIEGLAIDGTGWLFVSHISVTGRTYDLVKKIYPRATFATIFQKPQGKSDFFAESIGAGTEMSFYWNASRNEQADARSYEMGIVTPADLKAHARILKEHLPKIIALSDIKGFVVVTRGGMIPALFLRELLAQEIPQALNFKAFGMESYTGSNEQKELRVIKDLYLPNFGEGFVFIEDMVDTGVSAKKIAEKFPLAKIITVHAKPAGQEKAHCFAVKTPQDLWVTYYWEISDQKK